MPWPVTACLLCLNEERNLEKYFGRIRPLVREIVVVDSGSTDNSREIAGRHADLVVANPLVSFSAQRNLASSRAAHRWVLHLDADESMTDSLSAAITELFESGSIDRYAAFCFPRKTFDEEGRLRKIVESYPGFHYRLYDRERCRWVKPVHETLEIDGPKKFVPHHILHHPDYSRVPEKLTLYTDLKDRPSSDPRRATAGSMASNFLFHAKALYVDLGMWKRPADLVFASRWLLHQAGVRLRRRMGK